MKDLLGKEWLDDFFAPVDNHILNRRESQSIEFKSEFDWLNKDKQAAYLKSLVSFANNKGGYLIFGIGKNPHTIEGCDGFENVDIAAITDAILKYFHCEIVIQKSSIGFSSKLVGILAVNECANKPIICIKNYNNHKGETILRESAIYYRYPGRSSEIKSGDLINLINGVKDNINQRWMSSLSKIADQGIDKIGILDTQSGLLKINDSKFIVDESLLNNLKVVDKYSEKIDGEPALRIIGEIGEAVRIINRNKTIEEFEVIQEFLERKKNFEYNSILDRIPNFSSFVYPFFYFIQSVDKSADTYRSYLLNKPKYSSSTPFIQKMLDGHDGWLLKRKEQAPLSSNREKGRKRTLYYLLLKETTELSPPEDDIIAFCEAFLHVDKENFNLTFLRAELYKIFLNYYKNSKFCKSIREACCAIDLIEFN